MKHCILIQYLIVEHFENEEKQNEGKKCSFQWTTTIISMYFLQAFSQIEHYFITLVYITVIILV